MGTRLNNMCSFQNKQTKTKIIQVHTVQLEKFADEILVHVQYFFSKKKNTIEPIKPG